MQENHCRYYERCLKAMNEAGGHTRMFFWGASAVSNFNLNRCMFFFLKALHMIAVQCYID